MNKILILILLVAALFRFVGVTQSPPALNWDEASIGYNAYSILKTGKDEWGEFLPLNFRAFGEQKLPGMIYASIPGIAIFGLNDFGVRVTPALLGVLSVYLIYLLAYKIFAKKELALASAFLLAISPWAVHFSRVAFEAGLALALTLLSLYFLVLAGSKPKYYWLSLIFAIFALYTYNSVRILLPLLLFAYLINGVIKFTGKTKKTLLLVLVVGFVLSLPILFSLATKEGRVRWGTLSIMSQKSFVDDIAESRGYTTLPSILPRLIHNKPTHFVYKFLHNYISTFSSEFLFLKGSSNTQRSVQEMGLLYLFELPLLVVGLFELGSKGGSKISKASKIIMPFFLLASVPSALTIDAPSSVRTLSLLPALILVESLGFMKLTRWFAGKKLVVRAVVVGFVLWSISYFAYKLWFVYPKKYADDWAYGYKQAYSWVYSQYASVDNIYITSKYGEPHIFALFYGQIDPKLYHSYDVKYSTDPLGWIHVYSFDKFHFTGFTGLETPEEIQARIPGKNLLLTSFAILPNDLKRDYELKAPNWKVMFEGTLIDGEVSN